MNQDSLTCSLIEGNSISSQVATDVPWLSFSFFEGGLAISIIHCKNYIFVRKYWEIPSSKVHCYIQNIQLEFFWKWFRICCSYASNLISCSELNRFCLYFHIPRVLFDDETKIMHFAIKCFGGVFKYWLQIINKFYAHLKANQTQTSCELVIWQIMNLFIGCINFTNYFP